MRSVTGLLAISISTSNKFKIRDTFQELTPQTFSGKYNKRLSGYNNVFTFPKGAASIKIQQKSFRNQIHDGNYLALVRPNGHYIFNGGLTLTTIKKDIEINGKA